MADELTWRGEKLLAADGAKIGTIEEIYLDAGDKEPEWAVVKTGPLGRTRRFVPLREAKRAEGGVRVPIEADRVKDAPDIDHDGRLTEPEEARLHRHYGRDG